MDRLYEELRATVMANIQTRENFRDIPVKVHIRRADRDTWTYLGRGIVTQEISGQRSQIGTRCKDFSEGALIV